MKNILGISLALFLCSCTGLQKDNVPKLSFDDNLNLYISPPVDMVINVSSDFDTKEFINRYNDAIQKYNRKRIKSSVNVGGGQKLLELSKRKM